MTWRPLAGVSLTAETWAVWPPDAPAAVADVLDVLTRSFRRPGALTCSNKCIF